MPDMDTSTLRIIDANLDRTAEGLRVLEDIARLTLSHGALSADLKALRHRLVQTSAAFQHELLWSRDPTGDVGRDTGAAGEERGKDVPSVLVANARRVQEALRVLEEMAKIPGIAPNLSTETFKQARFRIYGMERDMLALLLRQTKVGRLSGLYVIIDGQWLKGRSHAEIARQAIRGGARVIQLREKTMPRRALLILARDLRHICSDLNALFVVNDHLDVALDSNADGLHVGQDDLPVEVARRLLRPDQILGCSTSTVAQALAAQTAGADHVAVGSVFDTSTKGIDVVGIERMAEIRRVVTIPIIGIGGITMKNAGTVMAAGANAVAVISAVVSAADPTAAARELADVVEARR
jgi:thiamine-phosphate pyrophosphorylase